ncbi:serine/threonine-protein kinase [Nonomuraea sediminis]|uniref:serine/threonine-protein kinase n=1 Tax=Nonomuraea sediminis TaxID=2835864 RepID=UPI0027DF8A0B|nr:protein kinase [Nonomuraea sediminis]
MSQPLEEDDPRRLGSYEIVGRLGEGGQGVVYLGRTAEGEQVAIKLLHQGLLTDPDARARFLREVAIAQRVARFSTAPVLHADLEGRRPYIVSEYVPGPSLRALVTAEGPRRGAALERLAVATATALAAIHRAGILHRDFKPGNILMGQEGPVVIDFGIARALDAPGVTSTSTPMGTPAYLAPEQLRGVELTPAADVFAWGVTMVFAACGRPAFGADSTPAVISRILNTQPEISGLEGRLRDLVTASLAKDPAKRPSAEGLVRALTAPPSPPRRRRTALLTAGSALLAAAAIAVAFILYGRPVESTPALRQPEASAASSALPTPSTAGVVTDRTAAATPGRPSHRGTTTPTAKPTRTRSHQITVNTTVPTRSSAPEPSRQPTQEPTKEPSSQPAQSYWWLQQTPMENPFTCAPQMC